MNISNHRYTYLLISCRRSGTTYLRKKRACSVLLRCSRIAISSFTEKEGFHTWHILKELRPGGRLLWKTGGPPRCKKIEGEKVTLPLQSLKTRRVPRCSATLNVRTHFISCSLIALLFDHFMKGKWIRRKKPPGNGTFIGIGRLRVHRKWYLESSSNAASEGIINKGPHTASWIKSTLIGNGYLM